MTTEVGQALIKSLTDNPDEWRTEGNVLTNDSKHVSLFICSEEVHMYMLDSKLYMYPELLKITEDESSQIVSFFEKIKTSSDSKTAVEIKTNILGKFQG